MTQPDIRPATAADLPRLEAGLRALAQRLGDPYAALPEALQRAGFGANPAFRAVIAENGAALLGLALYSPVFSTIRGTTGLYVSDLWVAESARGAGLGRQLLGAAAQDAGAAWDARFLRLVVYRNNPAARRFYDRIGLRAAEGETVMTLDEAGLDALKGTI